MRVRDAAITTTTTTPDQMHLRERWRGGRYGGQPVGVNPASFRIDDYDSISVNGRLAGGLLAVERLLDKRRIRSRQADDLLDHLWKWLTVDEHSFGDWEAWTSELLEFALGGDLPSDVEREFESLGLPASALRRLW